jgi:hypothetical protein
VDRRGRRYAESEQKGQGDRELFRHGGRTPVEERISHATLRTSGRGRARGPTSGSPGEGQRAAGRSPPAETPRKPPG